MSDCDSGSYSSDDDTGVDCYNCRENIKNGTKLYSLKWRNQEMNDDLLDYGPFNGQHYYADIYAYFCESCCNKFNIRRKIMDVIDNLNDEEVLTKSATKN